MEGLYIRAFIDKKAEITRDEADALLRWLHEYPDVYKREERIAVTEAYIERIDRREAADAAYEAGWIAKANEIETIKRSWTDMGATWTEKHDCGVGKTTWTFPDGRAWSWWSYETLDETLASIWAFNDKLTEV